MRIALVSTPFVTVPPRDYGGTELVVYELAEGLVGRGHGVTLFATADSHSHAEVRGLFPSAQWPPDTLIDADHITWSAREILAGEFDLVHVHSPVALAISRLLPPMPLVYTIHHDADARLSAYYQQFPDVYYVTITRDQASREPWLQRGQTIHHGLDPDRYACAECASDYVCFLSRLAPVKAPHIAIDAAGAAGVRIRVGGTVHDVDREYGAREVQPRLELEHVDYLGAVDTHRKTPLLRDARALLAPIQWNEPFGLVLVEAMFSGCPPIAFPRGSAQEVIEDGMTGFLVEEPDQMTELIRPGGPVDQFDRQACRARAIERFGRERMVRDHEHLYQRAIAQFSATPPDRAPTAA
jgi:glycosyltransferase involved in cell wall biosynthesis